VYRRSRDTSEWPYFSGSRERDGESARARLIPYHQWANRGPATMRVWLPLAEAAAGIEGTRVSAG